MASQRIELMHALRLSLPSLQSLLSYPPPKPSDRADVQSREVRLPDSSPISLDDQDVQIVLAMLEVVQFRFPDTSTKYFQAVTNMKYGFLAEDLLRNLATSGNARTHTIGQISSAEDAIQRLTGVVIGSQMVRLSWGRSPGNKQNGAYYGRQGYGYAVPQNQDPNMYAGAYGGSSNGYCNRQQSVSSGIHVRILILWHSISDEDRSVLLD